MADIGDRHHQPPAPAAQPFGVHRIVEVPSILAVDGHQRQITQILAACPVVGQNLRIELVRLVQHLGREFLRQVVPQDGKACGKIRGTHIGEHLDDAPMRRLLALRPPSDLDDDVVAVARTLREPLRHLHRIPMPRIFRLHLAEVRVIHAAYAVRRIGGAADQPRDPAPAVVDADREHLGRIVVHQRRRVGAREHQWGRAVDRHHEHIAVGTAAHAPGQPLALPGRGKSVGARDRLSVAHHRRQSLGEGVAFGIGVQPQALGQPGHGERLVRLREVPKNELTAGNRMRIAHLLEREVRILLAPFAAFLRPRAFRIRHRLTASDSWPR